MPKRASASEQDVLPSAALGLIAMPSGRVTVDGANLRGRGRSRALKLGNPEVDIEPGRRIRGCRGRLRVEAGVEGELIATGGGRPRSFFGGHFPL